MRYPFLQCLSKTSIGSNYFTLPRPFAVSLSEYSIHSNSTDYKVKFISISQGYKSHQIVWSEQRSRWELSARGNSSAVVAVYNGTSLYPLGLETWSVVSLGDCPELSGQSAVQLKLTQCDEERDFSCHDGKCVRFEDRCDNKVKISAAIKSFSKLVESQNKTFLD